MREFKILSCCVHTEKFCCVGDATPAECGHPRHVASQYRGVPSYPSQDSKFETGGQTCTQSCLNITNRHPETDQITFS